MIKSFLLFLLISPAQVTDSAQTFMYPQEILDQANSLYANQEYEAAADTYSLISENDTSYVEAQVDLMITYNELNQYDKTIELGKELVTKPTKLRRTIYITLGNAYLNQGVYDQALKIYKEGLERYPHSYILLYNMGLAYRLMEQYDTAEKYFEKSISINPYYSYNHIMMGYIAVLQGHRTKAMLSYLTALAISPNKNNILIYANKLASDGVRDEGTIDEVDDNSLFQNYDDLLKSKAALDSRFHQEVAFNANIVKQTEFLLSRLKYEPGTDDFWMNFYVPMFTEIKNKNLQTPFVYELLKSTSNEEVLKYIEKHATERNAWIDIANEVLNQYRSKNEVTLLNKKDTYTFWYFNSNDLSAIGNQIDDETRIGPWQFFYENSQLNAQGIYTDEGLKTGEWTYYYENGRLSHIEMYENGKETDPVQYFNDKGALIATAKYIDGQLDGPLKHYYPCGEIKEIIPYVSGAKHGKASFFNETGQKIVDYNLDSGLYQGDYIKYFPTGQLNIKYTYVNDQIEGPYISYYSNGQVYEKGDYKEGQLDGEWFGYHPNGAVMYKGQLENGNDIGSWEYYYDNGNKKETVYYNEAYEVDSLDRIYTENGHLWKELHYTSGLLTGLRYFDYQGNVLFESSDPEGNMDCKAYYATGELNYTCTMKNGLMEGPFTSYHKNGKVYQEATMKEDSFDGMYKEYYESGVLHVMCTYAEGSLNGTYEEYYKDGSKSDVGYYVNGQPEQYWRVFFPNGQIKQENYSISGQLQGKNNFYDPKGRLQLTEIYEEGTLSASIQYDSLGNEILTNDLKFGTGQYTTISISGDTLSTLSFQCGVKASDLHTYYLNGKPERISPVKYGEFNGAFKAFYPSGAISTKGTYKDNLQEGHWQWYYENGKLRSEGTIIKGDYNGKLTHYYYNGSRESVSMYKDDEKDGPAKYYAPSGELQLIKLYDKTDGLTGYINNQTHDTIPFIEKGTFTLETFFDNGQKAAIQHFKDGLYDQVTSYYNTNGKLKEEIQYKDGELNGYWKVFYINGNLMTETPYYYGMVHGTQKEYYENGHLKRETSYAYDDKNGWEIEYNQDGTVQHKTYYWNGDIY